MPARTSGRRRQLLATVTAAVAVLTLLVATPPAVAGPNIEMFTSTWAPDGIPTQVSEERFEHSSAPYAVLVRDDVYADALAGTVLTDVAPLLASPSDELGYSARHELRRVLTEDAPVLMLGGTVALSDQVADDLADMGFTPVRVSGENRIETARKVVELARGQSVPAPLEGLFEPVEDSRVMLARARPRPGDTSQGTGWVDAVAGGA